MANVGFWQTVRREIRRMCSRKMYLAGMVVVPVFMALFFVCLLHEGLPLKVPTAIVDLDHSSMSRSITRSLNATELIDISKHCESYDDAMTDIRTGDIYGFFVIPANFERDVLAGKTPTLEYYNNLTYYVPGTLTFKGFKTIAVSTSGAVVRTMLVTAGMHDDSVGPMLQPVSIQGRPIGNPWLSYAVYLSPTFIFAMLALMIYLMTVFSITMEIKNGTSVQWLASAHNHITVAVAAKLLPHFVVWSVVGQFCLALMFGFNHFPCGNIWAMMGAMELFIIASMGFGLFFTCVVPNPRLAFICCALIGILSFSFAGISFPVQNMYGAVAIFSYLVPVRYLMLIYFTVGLDGFPIYYARMYYVALIIFPFVASLLLWRLRRACLKPVYVP